MTNLSVGRGTDVPFEIIGAPLLNDQKPTREPNQAGLSGARVTSRFLSAFRADTK
jgi:uncharacterized protein YbbC (DUF1343 family)